MPRWSAALVLALLLPASCASRGPRSFETAAPSSPRIRGAENGLEVISWIIEDSTGAVGRTLASYPATPLAPADAAVWRRAGLRLVALPEERLGELRASLQTGGAVQRQWFGLLPRWTPVVKGPAWRGQRIIGAERTGAETVPATDAPPTGEFALGPGRLRMMARCWNEPVIEPSDDGGGAVVAVLHLELVPQHEEAVPPARRLTVAVEAPPGPEEQGLVFRRLTIAFPARRSVAYIIVPESPTADWLPVEETSTDRPGIPARPGDPSIPLAPTLGEAMLTDAEASGTARHRLLLILVPRVPGSFELIAEPQGQ